MSESEQLIPELQGYYDQISAIRRDAGLMIGNLSEAQFAWQPAPNRWSIAQCLEHLNAISRNYLPLILASINDARMEGRVGNGPFKYGWISSYFVRSTEPPTRRRLPSPRRFLPPPDRPMSEIWPSFLAFQDRLQEMIVHANGVDLARARVQSPALKIFSMALGQTFSFMLAHERRHLWQAGRVREESGFPN